MISFIPMDSKTTMSNDDLEKEKEEVTLIVIDNSMRMRSSASFQNQLEAIEIYCRHKLESNPKKNAIGLWAMGREACSHHSGFPTSYLKATNDVEKILAHLKGIDYRGDLEILSWIRLSMSLVNRYHDFKHKRLLFFVGGPTDLLGDTAKMMGQYTNKMGVAVTVVNFCRLELYKTGLDLFVAAADNNGNSYIDHVLPGSSRPVIHKALSSPSSPPIITRAAMDPWEETAAAWKKFRQDKADGRPKLRPLNRKGKYQVAPPPPKAPLLGNKFDLLSLGNEKAMLAKGKMPWR